MQHKRTSEVKGKNKLKNGGKTTYSICREKYAPRLIDKLYGVWCERKRVEKTNMKVLFLAILLLF